MTKNRIIKLALILLAISVLGISSCKKCKDKVKTATDNPIEYITDKAKLDMIYSLKDIDHKQQGRFYEMHYTANYKLEEAIQAQLTSLEGLTAFLATNLFDKVPEQATKMDYSAGCSAFAAPDPANGNYYMGRNFDFCHTDKDKKEIPISAIVVHSTSAEGKKSISMVDSYWVGLKQGFFTDGKSDLSILMALPYLLMDGINEDGFAIGVLHLGGNPTKQDAPGKLNINTTIAMRMLLDKATSVDHAIELLKQYNMNMESPAGGNYHFFMADAGGNYAIIEYIFENEDTDSTPNKMMVFTQNDTMRYVTNFYITPTLAANNTIGGAAERGKWRYNTMKENLKVNAYKLTKEQAMDLLKAVATDANVTEPTSHTQWSSLYNLSQKTLDVAILKEYGKKEVKHFSFN